MRAAPGACGGKSASRAKWDQRPWARTPTAALPAAKPYPLHSVDLDGLQGLAVDAGGTLVATDLLPSPPHDIRPSDPVVESGEFPLTVPLRGHVERALKCMDFVNGGVGLSHALARTLQHARHRSAGPFLSSPQVCLGGHQYYYPLRLPPHCPGLRCGLIPGPASAAIDLTHGCGRVSPSSRSAFIACRLRSGSGLLQIPRPGLLPSPHPTGLGPLCPYGIKFSTRQISLSLRPAASLLLASPPRSHRTLEVDFGAPLAACPGGTHTRPSIGPSGQHWGAFIRPPRRDAGSRRATWLAPQPA